MESFEFSPERAQQCSYALYGALQQPPPAQQFRFQPQYVHTLPALQHLQFPSFQQTQQVPLNGTFQQSCVAPITYQPVTNVPLPPQGQMFHGSPAAYRQLPVPIPQAGYGIPVGMADYESPLHSFHMPHPYSADLGNVQRPAGSRYMSQAHSSSSMNPYQLGGQQSPFMPPPPTPFNSHAQQALGHMNYHPLSVATQHMRGGAGGGTTNLNMQAHNAGSFHTRHYSNNYNTAQEAMAHAHMVPRFTTRQGYVPVKQSTMQPNMPTATARLNDVLSTVQRITDVTEEDEVRAKVKPKSSSSSASKPRAKRETKVPTKRKSRAKVSVPAPTEVVVVLKPESVSQTSGAVKELDSGLDVQEVSPAQKRQRSLSLADGGGENPSKKMKTDG
ncbi:hypothetical protein EJ08DRAFT_339387 [Tothia fuscella]|uniref:Uncharacterized protein n=1 Tax=Tothia fuscella TaxID=1048955 RepID=A0A9P4P211_9PEZI|nr:hypothetical protein EJ08DRAFT_339387 [Tothia fuscella]